MWDRAACFSCSTSNQSPGSSSRCAVDALTCQVIPRAGQLAFEAVAMFTQVSRSGPGPVQVSRQTKPAAGHLAVARACRSSSTCDLRRSAPLPGRRTPGQFGGPPQHYGPAPPSTGSLRQVRSLMECAIASTGRPVSRSAAHPVPQQEGPLFRGWRMTLRQPFRLRWNSASTWRCSQISVGEVHRDMTSRLTNPSRWAS